MTLENILDASRAESQLRQEKHPLATIQRQVEAMGPTRGFARTLRSRAFSVIAEIKRKSPSMGSINEAALDIAPQIYNGHPVISAISVLTQEAHFGGTPDDLQKVRKLTEGPHPKPILRKDFIFTDYEVFFSRWIGADAILLMANILEGKQEFKRLHDLAVSIGLDVLCEIHDKTEIASLPDTVKICGINSRRFKGVNQRKPLWLQLKETFLGRSTERDMQTDLSTFDLYEDVTRQFPSGCLNVAESGISANNVGRVLKKYPFNAALIGTSLLKSSRSEMSTMLDKIQREAAAALGQNPARETAPVCTVSTESH